MVGSLLAVATDGVCLSEQKVYLLTYVTPNFNSQHQIVHLQVQSAQSACSAEYNQFMKIAHTVYAKKFHT